MPSLNHFTCLVVLYAQFSTVSFATPLTRSRSTTRTTGTFLVLTDVHLDKYYGSQFASSSPSCANTNAPKFGQAGCDLPFDLLSSAIKYAANITQETHPDFILVTGDSVRHNVHDINGEAPDDIVRDCMTNISGTLSQHFPDSVMATNMSNHANATFNDTTDVALLHIWETIGNNDVQPNYYINAARPLDQLEPLVDTWDVPTQEQQDFAHGGYYASAAIDGLMIISINTIWYAVNRPSDGGPLGDDPAGQFVWLENTLKIARANQTKAYIIGHIPPSMDSYGRHAMWKQEYIPKYRDLVTQYADVIEAQLFAHLHTNEFRTHPTWRVPILLQGAVTPVYKNNPTFRVYTYNQQTKEILDYVVYTASLLSTPLGGPPPSDTTELVWSRAYSFCEKYNLTSLSNQALTGLANTFQHDTHQFDRFFLALKGGAGGQVAGNTSCSNNVTCRHEWGCLLNNGFELTKYNECRLVQPSTVVHVTSSQSPTNTHQSPTDTHPSPTNTHPSTDTHESTHQPPPQTHTQTQTPPQTNNNNTNNYNIRFDSAMTVVGIAIGFIGVCAVAVVVFMIRRYRQSSKGNYQTLQILHHDEDNNIVNNAYDDDGINNVNFLSNNADDSDMFE